MKYALIATIEVNLPAKADALAAGVLSKIANKPLWTGQENRVVKGLSETGKPAVSIEYRFDNKIDQTEIASYLSQQRALLPFVSGTISIHDCYHDSGSKSCDNWQEI